jgi:hypothetical protein
MQYGFAQANTTGGVRVVTTYIKRRSSEIPSVLFKLFSWKSPLLAHLRIPYEIPILSACTVIIAMHPGHSPLDVLPLQRGMRKISLSYRCPPHVQTGSSIDQFFEVFQPLSASRSLA